MKIKAMMLKESLGNEPFTGVRVGEEADSIEVADLDGLTCFKIVLCKRRNHGHGFGDWLVMPNNVRWIELEPEPEPEKKGKK